MNRDKSTADEKFDVMSNLDGADAASLKMCLWKAIYPEHMIPANRETSDHADDVYNKWLLHVGCLPEELDQWICDYLLQ